MNRFIFSIILFLIPLYLLSQQNNNGTITGRILDSKNSQPIPFANIIINYTNNGTVSDNEGNFSISGITPGYVELVISCVGYKKFVSDPILITNSKQSYIEIQIEESDVELQEVKVEASFFRKKEESPVSLRRISIAEIERNPGGNRDISKVIQSLPGVASTPSYRNDLIVRGGGSAENRFFLDGVEIPNINHFATQGASGGSVGIINVDLIREVNFYSAAFPADRGNALSSILEFNQIDGNTEKMKFRGSVGASDLSLMLDGPINSKTNYIMSFRRSYLQFLFSALELPFLPTYNDFQFKVRKRINNHFDIMFLGLGAYDISKLNLEANKTEEQKYILGYLPENKQWNYTIGMVLKHFKKNGYDTWVISRNYIYNGAIKYLNNTELDSLKIYDYKSDEAENKLRYEHNSISASGFRFNYGAGLEYDTYTNQTLRALNSGELFNYNSSLKLFKWNLFGQISKNFFSDKLAISLGIRSDANNYERTMQNLLNQISPRFSVSYKLTDKWSVNSNIGNYYQLPPYTSLGFKNSSGEFVNKLNNIKYINSKHFVTGLDYLLNEETKISLEGFSKMYYKYPLSVSDSVSISSKGADFGTYGDEELLSTARGKTYGLELLFQSKNVMGFNTIFSYTYVRSEATNKKGKYIPTSWDNRNILNITATRSFKYNWDFGFKWRFVGGAPFTPYDTASSALVKVWDAQGKPVLDYNKFNQLRLRAFNQLDIRIDKKYYFNKWSLRVYLDIQNVFNYKSDTPDYIFRQTDSNGNYLPPSGDPLKYPLKVVQSSGSGQILPTVGIIIEF